MNTKRQGAVGVAIAVAYYTKLGYAVFVPVSDVSRYDLVVDNGSRLIRVEVKTTSQENGSLGLRTLGGNQSWSGEIKRISVNDCDEVFCYNVITESIKIYPASELEGKTKITVK